MKSAILSLIISIATLIFLLFPGIAFSEEWIAGSGSLYVDPTTTNIGIGTTTPVYKLDVNGSIKGLLLRVRNGTWTSNGNDIFINTGSTGQAIYFRPDGDGSGLGQVTYLATGVHNFFDSEGISQVIFNNGNVGIGTTTPDYKLDVLGTIRAQEVKVATGWSDFVFDDNYNLPSLESVELYIEKNNHLPDIPSAEEVKENGLPLAEIVTKQMQKIEELTLYVIEQNKQLIGLEEENIKLKQRDAELIERIIELEKLL